MVFEYFTFMTSPSAHLAMSPHVMCFLLLKEAIDGGKRVDFRNKPKKAVTHAAQNTMSRGSEGIREARSTSNNLGVMGSFCFGEAPFSRLMPRRVVSKCQFSWSGFFNPASKCRILKIFRYLGMEV